MAVQTDTLELLEPKLGGVALQLKELEAMKERGTLNDMTFAHAVHETTVLGPLTASLAAMGVLHDKGQLSDEELAFAKSVAFARYDRDDKGQVLLPGDSNPSTKPANVKLATTDDKRRGKQKRRRRKDEKRRNSPWRPPKKKQKPRSSGARPRRRAGTRSARRRRRPRPPYLKERPRRRRRPPPPRTPRPTPRRPRLCGKAEQGASRRPRRSPPRPRPTPTRRSARRQRRGRRRGRNDRPRGARGRRRGARGGGGAGEHRARHETRGAGTGTGTKPEPKAEDDDAAAAAAFMAQAAAEKAAFDEAAKKEAADIAAREAKAKAALEPLAKAREAARAATCEGWLQTGRCTPDGPRESHSDRSCDDDVPAGASGYCECGDGKAARSDCDHASFKCQAMCAARQATKDGGVARLAADGRLLAARPARGRFRPGLRRGGARGRVGLLRVPRRHARARVGLRPRHLPCGRRVLCTSASRTPTADRVRSSTPLKFICGAETSVTSRRIHIGGGCVGAAPPLATDAAFCKSSRERRSEVRHRTLAPRPCGWALAPSGSADTTPSRNALHLGRSNREQPGLPSGRTPRDETVRAARRLVATRGGCCPE